jgi:hypothetical protein
MVYLMHGIDTILTAVAPNLFAMQRQIVLEKRQPEKISLSVVGGNSNRPSNTASQRSVAGQAAA